MKTLLVIGSVWPEPNSSAAGGRMLQLLSIFKQEGYTIVFASAAMDSAYMVNLADYGIEKKNIVLNCSSFDAFAKALQPGVVLFDRFMTEEQFGWRVAASCPDALRVLDTEDLHSLRQARQKAFKEKRVFTTTDLLVEEVAKREIASILRCDLSLLVSEYEMELLTTLFKIEPALLHYLPLLVNPEALLETEQLPNYQTRRDFIFVGNFLHEPNFNAVLYLKETLWPLIQKQLPQAVLQVYGAYPSQKVLQLHNQKEGFWVMGRAANAMEVVSKARVVLAPLRFGAGIKGKLLEAMYCGSPSVTTTIGAEAMHGDLPWNGMVTDNPALFAAEAVRLYQDPVIWYQMQQNGFAMVRKRYLKPLFETDFKDKIVLLQTHLKTHRVHNFMGEMLQHHTLRSTKYLSKWIEEKNAK
ncbi:glycosyltransferase family 4 protein [Flavobacterium crassostreae]|uniref:Glycosyltransferase n=1 Tax=Flavobacterium crassostreae TaxID=1763534 RepID=A0A1B9E3Y0_9FLAO|nr:glycosyltransferase family 4 protein [Flavobacterium crassostreae]OCB76652.1 glycosyltransferase [Flavobacterium crassostreae]